MGLDTSNHLLSLSRKETNARKRIRLLAVSLFLAGQSRTNIAKRLSTARSSVNNWVSNYLKNGLAGLENKPITGRPSKLTPEQLCMLAAYIKNSSNNHEGGRLTGEGISNYIDAQFSVRYHVDHVYKLLKKLGFSWITSRSRHPKQSQVAQEAFKKLPNGNDPSHPGTPSFRTH